MFQQRPVFLALELAGYGIRVNAVCPGHLLDSPLWVGLLFRQYVERDGVSEEAVRRRYIGRVPLQRSCTDGDVGRAVVFLASAEGSYLTGQAIDVNGGKIMS